MLLFFCLIIIILLGLLFCFSELNIVIENLELTNLKEIKRKPNKIKIQFIFLGKVKWFSYSIKKSKIFNKVNISQLTQIQPKINSGKILLNLIKKCKINQLKLDIAIDINNVEILAYIVAIISTIIPNIIRIKTVFYNSNKFSYKIIPLFNNTNSFYIKLNCIFSIKLVHIINMLKDMKRRDKYERSSNRRFNVNCNGKHKEYDRC